MKRLTLIAFALIAACGGSGSRLRPHPGIWKEAEHRDNDVLAREFGLVRVMLVDPKFDKKLHSVVIKLWIENRSNDLIMMDSADLKLVEPGGQVCKNEAKAEKRELSGVYPELVVGEFAPTSPHRCRSEGFTLRFQVIPYSPVAGAPFPIEIILRPE